MPHNLDRIDKITRIHECNCTAADYDVPADKQCCRAIRSDNGGEVKVRLFDPWTSTYCDDVMILPAGSWVQSGNVVKVYRYYTGTTAAVSEIMDSTGVAVKGVKLGY